MNRNNDDRDRSRLFALLYMLDREEISPDDFDELQQLLRDNPKLQKTYLTYVDLAIEVPSLVGCNSHGMSDADVAAARLTLANAVDEDRNFDRQQSFSLTPTSNRQRWQRFAVLAIAASIALVVFSLQFRSHAPSESHVVVNTGLDTPQGGLSDVSPSARSTNHDVLLTQSAGAELFRDAVPAIGSVLAFNHEYSLTKGMLELRFPDGATAVLVAPAVLEIADVDRLIVKIGTCSVHAPPGAEGFRVLTPKAEVIDLGTRFVVGVKKGGETDVHVVEGEAEVRQIDSRGEAHTLVEHQARRYVGLVDIASDRLDFREDRYVEALPDRVVRYQARPSEGPHVSELMSVEVQRGGQIMNYRVDELIGIQVVHFGGSKNSYCLMDQVGSSVNGLGSSDRLSVLESDAKLNTGIINPGGSLEPLTSDPVMSFDEAANEHAAANPTELTPGLGFRFRLPVVNGPGPDVVLFEVQSVIDPSEGDHFHVSPLKFREGLKSTTIRRFDITMLSPEAQSVETFDLAIFDSAPNSLSQLVSTGYRLTKPPFRFLALAVGIDLSDLGYNIGETAEGLFLQDAQLSHSTLDPVFIGGFPKESDFVEANK